MSRGSPGSANISWIRSSPILIRLPFMGGFIPNILGIIGFWQNGSLMPFIIELPVKRFGFMRSWIAGDLRLALKSG